MPAPKKSKYPQSIIIFILIILSISTVYFFGDSTFGLNSTPATEVEISKIYSNDLLALKSKINELNEKLVVENLNNNQEEIKEIQTAISKLQAQIESKKYVTAISVKENIVTATLADGSQIVANKESMDNVTDHFEAGSININVENTEGKKFWISLIAGALPFVLLVAFLFFMMKQAQSSNSSAMSFGKSKARLYNQDKKRITFANVAGAKEAKEELKEIVDFLKNPQKYHKIGAKIPRGVMLFGSPGTGKTLLAKAVAGEARVPFFNISGSEFVEMFVGVGASRVRDLFNKAKRNSPSIIFVDEIDAVGRQRGTGLGGGHDEREQTLNQILVEMDGFDTNNNVIVIAATNRPDVLDPALLRPGRFDRRVVIDMPDIEDRDAILKVHAKNKPIQKGVNLKTIAKQTSGFTGADLENLLNEAAILTAKENKSKITQENIEQSIEKVLMGPERKSKVLSSDEKKITAFHETGHAIVGASLKNCNEVHKVSIISRGMALGVTWFMPDEDKHLHSKSYFEDEIASMLGGYIAEELTFGEVTTGSSNDLSRASQLARKMISQFGMSSKIGPVIYGNPHAAVFLGKEIHEGRNFSEQTAAIIDQEVSEIVKAAYSKAKKILTTKKEKLEQIALILIKKETLSGKEFKKLINN